MDIDPDADCQGKNYTSVIGKNMVSFFFF